MKPEEADEFRKFFTLKKPEPDSEGMRILKKLSAKPSTSVNPPSPRFIGCSSQKIQFTVDMSKCKWR